VAAAVRAVIAADFGMDVPVIVRSPAQLRQVVAANPFSAEAVQRPNLTHVSFLEAPPTAEALAAFRAVDLGADRAQVIGSEAYICYAEGVQGSRVPTAMRRLGVDGTARNWRTVTTLADLAGAKPR